MEVVPQGGVSNAPVGPVPVCIDRGVGVARGLVVLRSDDIDAVHNGPGEYEAAARGVLHVWLLGG